MPDEIARTVQQRAEARGISVSRYLAELVRREVAGGWPAGFFEDVAGKWDGPLERSAEGETEGRESL